MARDENRVLFFYEDYRESDERDRAFSNNYLHTIPGLTDEQKNNWISGQSNYFQK